MLPAYLKEERPIAHVVTFHAAALPLGLALKRLSGCRLTVVATDFALYNWHYDDAVDEYFVPPLVRAVGRLAKTLRHDPRLSSVGIPIGRGFTHCSHQPRDGIHVLVSFGGSGLRGANNVGLIAELIRATPNDVKWTIVTGQNREFFFEAARIRSRAKPRRVNIIRFTEDMASLMASADVVLGKAGGLTVSEALALGRPTIVVDTLPGQEIYNADALLDAGAGLRTRASGRILEFLERLRGVRSLISASADLDPRTP
jgi:processive 1,2-diacylglycerol beta-glucosyltransferase